MNYPAVGSTTGSAVPGGASGQLWLSHLALRDFRNLAHVEIEVPRTGFVLLGDNAQGKTNLLEAIHYLHAFRSLRGAPDWELVRHGATFFHIAAAVAGSATLFEVSAAYDRASGTKRILLDGVHCARLSDALGVLPSVVIAPTDLALVAGPPTLRRRFLDVILAATSRSYLDALQRYRGALAQRNAVLRRAGSSLQVAAWEPLLAEHGALLWYERSRWVSWARERVGALLAGLGEAAAISLVHRTGLNGWGASQSELAERLREALREQRERDRARGMTAVGPHRDDLEVRLEGLPLRRYGSAGQQRSAAIALRVLERWWYRDVGGRDVLILLDDPFAELDSIRSQGVLETVALSGRAQVVLAVPRASDIPGQFRGLPVLRVRGGVVAPTAEV
jgi:DNA replication and repair protein RecF